LQNWIIEVSTYKKILQQLGTLLSLTNSIPSTSPVDIHIEFFPEIRRQVVAVSI